ncbi:hypothetical protein JK358_10010 [Nocardia sp. 2]|uniref:Uncharacterized protein n=1 Tax=Nocardia acididurans TaxID=2802282 RepID=A0ABS1M2I9_9NOCA|nr:hypothetical protein [Nocardia acididurans]MBL1074731.1 hypothetical protein [Nocardia acididurans]
MRTVCLNCLSEFRYDRATDSWFRIIRKANGDHAKQLGVLFDKFNLKCPNGCEIDEEMLNHPTKVIGFVGESASSKTHLIVSMIHSMMNDPVLAQEWSIILTRKSVRLWASLEDQLVNRKAIRATEGRKFAGNQLQKIDTPPAPGGAQRQQQQQQPRHHAWSHLQQRTPIVVKVSSLYTRRTVNLAFVDVAGEDITDGAVAAQVSPHLAVADFLWFVVPSTLNKQYLSIMREHAGPANEDSLSNDVEHSQTVGRTNVMIDQISNMWRTANSYPAHQPIEPPRLHVSTILAKSDLLSLIDMPEVSIVAPPSDWAQSPLCTNGSGNLYNWNQMDYRSQATRSLVRKLFPAVDTTLSIHFPYNRYFPVSAVGCGKRSDNSYPVFKPYAASDPMLYMLSLMDELRTDR